MKFIINTTNMQTGGALQVSLSLLQEWRRYPDYEFHVFLSPQMNELIDRAAYPSFFHFYRLPVNPTHSLWTAATFGRRLSRLEKRIRPDAVFTVFGPALWIPESPHVVGFANGYYLFDTAAYIREQVTGSVSQRLQYYLRRRMLLGQLRKEASVCWVETELARTRLLEEWGGHVLPVTVIGNTYGTSFTAFAADSAPAAVPFTLLCLTAYYPHKNLELLPAVILLLQQERLSCRFVVTLPDHVFQRLFGAGNEYIYNAGPQAPDQLPGLYARVHAVFQPTLLETFSAVYPEAMKAGKPVLTSDLDFARSICGEAALYFDPLSATDAAAKIGLLVGDVALQQQLIQKGQLQLGRMETPESRAAKLLALLVAQVAS